MGIILHIIAHTRPHRTAVGGHRLHDEETLGRAGRQVGPVVGAREAVHGRGDHELGAELRQAARGRHLRDGEKRGGVVGGAGVVDLG